MGTALVFIDRPPVRLAADAVLLDNFYGASLAVEHLISEGHRRIAFLSDPPADMYTAAERFRGYSQTLIAAGISIEERLVAFGLHVREVLPSACRRC